MLHVDITAHICYYLSDKEILSLSATTHNFKSIKFRVTFYTQMRIKDIINLPYFDRFCNIIVENLTKPVPKYISHLTFGTCFDQTIKDYIPDSVTHVTFGVCFMYCHFQILIMISLSTHGQT